MKKCRICKELKYKSEFHKHKRMKDGLHSECKKCATELQRKRAKTKDGLITKIYARQRQSCVDRGNESPKYSNKNLNKWCIEQPLFHELHNNWEKSGYLKSLTPSIDRKDDYISYNFDNIQLMTWGENNRKSHKDNKTGKIRKAWKKLNQYDLEGNFIKQWGSGVQVEKCLGIARNHIPSVCKGKRKQAGGFIWRYADEN